uniref:Uncharacterized protein n=1 Tax=Anguilla anguilla TaxID=7936 RepID=A0A0E9U9H5_ANGAN
MFENVKTLPSTFETCTFNAYAIYIVYIVCFLGCYF